MYKYRIKIYVDEIGTYRFLPQRKWFLFWISANTIYPTYQKAYKALGNYKRKIEGGVYKYIKEEDL